MSLEEASEPRGRPGRRPKPAVPVTETPEFRDAVNAAVNAAKADILATLASARGIAAEGVTSGDKSWAEEVAMAIAQLTDQGTGRQRVSPDIIRSRSEARERMQRLIVAAKAAAQAPTYQLRNKVLLGNRVIDPMWIDSSHITHATEIDWFGVPNEAMIPINAAAKDIHEAFMASIGSVPKAVPEETLGITAGGLVVRNGAVNAAAQVRAVRSTVAGSEEEGVRVHHAHEPGRTIEKHILGTIHEPARQTV